MMKTSENTLANDDIHSDEIVTESGRIFRPGNKELLANIPPAIVQEMAKQKWEEIKAAKEGDSHS